MNVARIAETEDEKVKCKNDNESVLDLIVIMLLQDIINEKKANQ